MKRFVSAVLGALLASWTSLAFGSEVIIPLPPNSGVELGQGFDLRTMEWRERCAMGRELQTPPSEANVETASDLSSVYSVEETSGSLAGGASLLGGLAAVKAKNTFHSSWVDSTYSKGSMFRMDFGFGRWELRDIRPLVPLSQDQSFRKRCGTHVVVRLESQNELLFLVKYLSLQQSWLEKIRWEVKAKGFWGLSKKSWSEERIREGGDEQASIKVGVRAKGYFKDLLAGRLGAGDEIEITCRYPAIQRCQDLFGSFEDTIGFVKEKAATDGVDLMDRDLTSAAVLVPYPQAGPRFVGVRSLPDSVEKIHLLNAMRRQYFRLEAQRVDADTLGLPMDHDVELNRNIEKMKRKIALCEGKNLCN